jgi:prenyltransferase beta subunit
MKKLKRGFIIIMLLIILVTLFCAYYWNREITDIKDSISKGIDYLEDNQNKDGSVSLNNDSTFKVWETANTLFVVRASKEDKKSFIDNATNFLLSAQRDDGSFYHTVSFKKDYYCMETTSISIIALSGNKESINKGTFFILDKQTKNGSWEIGTPFINKERFFPSISGFALISLMCQNIYNGNISKGIEYIQKSQLEDGSWGNSWIYYDTPYYAIYVNLLALKLYGMEDSDNYKKAIDYIQENQNSDGSWGGKNTGRPSKSLRTSLALNSLLINPDKENSETIEKGFEWLIKKQSYDGHWEGGYFVNVPDKKEDIFATDMAILALIRYKSYKNNEIFLCPLFL